MDRKSLQVFPADVQQTLLIRGDAPEEWRPDVDQQDPEHLHIKEEEEELWTQLEGEKFNVKEETDASRFSFTAVHVKTEDDEEKLLFSQLHQQNPEPLHIKEEEEELWTRLEGDQLNMKEETDASRFSFTTVPLKSEDDEEKPLFSQLHQHQREDRDVPTSSSADQMKVEADGEDCGGAETSRCPDLNLHEDASSSSETEVSEDDEEDEDGNNPDSQLEHLSDTGSTTEDSDKDCKESRAPDSAVNSVNKCFSCSECGKQFLHKRSLQRHMTCHSTGRRSSCLGQKKSVRKKKSVSQLHKLRTAYHLLTILISCFSVGPVNVSPRPPSGTILPGPPEPCRIWELLVRREGMYPSPHPPLGLMGLAFAGCSKSAGSPESAEGSTFLSSTSVPESSTFLSSDIESSAEVLKSAAVAEVLTPSAAASPPSPAETTVLPLLTPGAGELMGS
ncbi:uncharacterized protein LOC119412071 [Nematolebias whitei]|uniref:uncharacterized protein LOC119412071 n=1 Tax=Nematolebias whitei TaxID=451745 RepID=UPI001899627E|nr:uncharacterized protein LOC119412071 [Nematolebias whitei]